MKDIRKEIERFEKGEITKDELASILNEDREELAHQAFYKGREVKYFDSNGHKSNVPIFEIPTFNAFLRGDKIDNHTVGDLTLDNRRSIPVKRVRSLAYSVAHWAIQHEKLRETQEVIREAVESGLEFPNAPELVGHWVDDFKSYFDGCAVSILNGLDADQKYMQERKKELNKKS